MKILIEKPPIYDEAVRVLGIQDKKVCFCWGDIIFNPFNFEITPELLAHEEVHMEQQAAYGGPEEWWKYYLAVPSYRLSMEMPAHIRQYEKFCERHKDPNRRARMAHILACVLSGPIYGKIISHREALQRIKG